MLLWLDNLVQKIISKNSFVLIFIFCAVFFAYGNILVGDFVFDDNIFIENNIQIRSLSNTEVIYQSSTTAGSGLTNDNFYRPNQQFIYAILYSFGGLNSFFFHLVPILFHILNGFLIFLLFIRLGISRQASFLAMLLFLLHPVLTQAVSYISGLSEPLVASTILGSLLVFIEILKDVDQKKFHKLLGLGALIFTIGLMSKESQVVALPLMVIIFIFKWSNINQSEIKNKREKILRACVFIGTLTILFLIYLYARINFLNFTGVIGLTGELNSYTTSIWVRLSTFIHILPEYFKMMLFPWHLYYEKPYVAYGSLLSFQSAFGILIIISGFFAGFYSILKKSGKVFLGVAWFFTALIPVSGIIPINSMYLEHWLYIPMIGFIFMLAHWFEERGVRTRGIITFILLGILILFSFRIIARNIEWGNPVKFYQRELKYTQTSARIYTNLGLEQAKRGDCVSAVPNYKKAIELNDSYPQSHHNLARCHEAMGNVEESVNEYLKALSIEPNPDRSV